MDKREPLPDANSNGANSIYLRDIAQSLRELIEILDDDQNGPVYYLRSIGETFQQIEKIAKTD